MSRTSTQTAARWAKDWQVALQIWIERRGETILGESLADLLGAIGQTHSINGAAQSLGVSYRHAWKLIQEANAAAGEPLIVAAVGGLHGGGTRLTPLGELALEVFEQMSRQVRRSAAGALQQALTTEGEAATTLHLAAAISLQEVVGQLLTEYALQQPTIQVRAVFGSSNELAEHVLAGAPCDVFISADPLHLDHLAAARLLKPKSRRAVAANSLAIIGPSQHARSLAKPADLLQPEFKQVALADPASPLGKYAKAYLQRHDLYDALLAKVVQVDNSRGVLAAIRSGRADAAIAFQSDAAKSSECRALYVIDPAEAGLEYSAAVLKSGQRDAAALELLDFFASPVARRCFRRCDLALPSSRRAASKA